MVYCIITIKFYLYFQGYFTQTILLSNDYSSASEATWTKAWYRKNLSIDDSNNKMLYICVVYISSFASSDTIINSKISIALIGFEMDVVDCTESCLV